MHEEIEGQGTDPELLDSRDVSDAKEIPITEDTPEEAGTESEGVTDRELQETKDLLLRKQAEFENYRKRVVREKSQIRLDSQAELIEALLPVLDAGQKALDGLQEAEGGTNLESYQQGFELLLGEMKTVFERYGVESIPAVGEPFDPNLHEAIGRLESDQQQDGTVLEEVRVGYTLRGRLLRASQVMVAVSGGGSKE